jgi:signal transduction histidine kinase
MTTMRWWDAAVLGTAALLAILLLVLTDVPWRLGVGFAGIAVLVVAWIALGRRGSDAATVTPFIVVVVLTSGLVVAAYPTLAIIQVIAYPIAWSFSATLRRAVVANIAIALAVGVGFLVSLGTGTANLVQTAFTVALSLIFSLAMGFWISRMTALGEERGRLLVELQGAQEQIAALNRAAGAADERERMARDLHDTIAQDLTGLVMLAQRARREASGPDATLALLEESARAALTEPAPSSLPAPPWLMTVSTLPARCVGLPIASCARRACRLNSLSTPVSRSRATSRWWRCDACKRPSATPESTREPHACRST